MDPFLAEYYGTGDDAVGYDDDALEKMAQLTLLTKEAAEEGIDLSNLSEGELYDLADEVYGGYAPMEKEASDMFETADFSGRIMAHAMWNELDNIQKIARKGGRSGGEVLEGGAFDKVEGIKKKKVTPKESMTMKEFGRKVSRAPGRAAQYVGEKVTPFALKQRLAERAGGSAKKWGRYMKGVGGATMGLGAAAAGGAGYLAHKKMKESSDSAFDALVEQRAMDHLYASGYADDYGNVYEPEYEKTASGFDEVVDDYALAYLSELGYPVE